MSRRLVQALEELEKLLEWAHMVVLEKLQDVWAYTQALHTHTRVHMECVVHTLYNQEVDTHA
jgi:hypothetical protein